MHQFSAFREKPEVGIILIEGNGFCISDKVFGLYLQGNKPAFIGDGIVDQVFAVSALVNRQGIFFIVECNDQGELFFMMIVKDKRVKEGIQPPFIMRFFHQYDLTDGIRFFLCGSIKHPDILFEEKIGPEVFVPCGICPDQIRTFGIFRV